MVSTANPYTFNLETKTDIVGIFEENEIFNVIATSNIGGKNVWQSDTSVFSGEEITLKARNVSGYKFVNWSNGSTSNPLELVVEENINIEAIYMPVSENNITYDWYAYIKDQMTLNTPPKALLRVLSFNVKNDLMTATNSALNVLEIPSNVSIGDILCLYNPKGIVRYMGVIKSIENNEIQCSQMQSFYNGNWVIETYNTITNIEGEFKYVLKRFADGYVKGGSYQDTLQKQKKSQYI